MTNPLASPRRPPFWRPVLRLFPQGLALAMLSIVWQAWGAAPADGVQAPVLTAFGAEADGDRDGIIPRYQGGLREIPPTYRPGRNLRPDPFHREKPLFAITAHNEAEFDDMLTDGAKMLLSRYPDFRIDVYTTHRTAVYPQAVLDATALNAQRCATANGGRSVVGNGCRGGLPFPTPKTGYEAMWDHLLAWSGTAMAGRERDWLVDRLRRPSLLAQSNLYLGFPWYSDPAFAAREPYRQRLSTIEEPARSAGQRSLLLDYIDPVKFPRIDWQYLLGERGVRLAADATQDQAADTGGLRFYDQVGLFSGSLDVFDFRLVGKRDMIIPYNTYKQVYICQPVDDLQPHFINPDCLRWELHRVWIVEAVLKGGQQHTSTRRVFYWDEDSWNAGASDEYDFKGELYRSGFVHFNVWYESQINSAQQYVIYDFKRRAYALYGEAARADGPHAVDPLPANQLTPDMMASTSVR
jgi:hypothetical protein